MLVRRVGLHLRWLLPVIFLLSARPALAVNKVTLTPSTITLTEGQSQLVQVALSEPLISSPGPAYARLDLNDPSGRLQFDPASITVPASGWATTYSFTVTAVDDALDNGDATPTSLALITSNSEYYSNYAPMLNVTVLDNDDAPVMPAVLPKVGPSTSLWSLLLAASLALSAALYITRRQAE